MTSWTPASQLLVPLGVQYLAAVAIPPRILLVDIVNRRRVCSSCSTCRTCACEVQQGEGLQTAYGVHGGSPSPVRRIHSIVKIWLYSTHAARNLRTMLPCLAGASNQLRCVSDHLPLRRVAAAAAAAAAAARPSSNQAATGGGAPEALPHRLPVDLQTGNTVHCTVCRHSLVLCAGAAWPQSVCRDPPPTPLSGLLPLLLLSLLSLTLKLLSPSPKGGPSPSSCCCRCCCRNCSH
jgi:hypothetical protein